MSVSTLTINQLPDDCLLKIFYLICDLPDLIHCYQVCQKWNQLICLRARKAKYLLVGWSQLRTWKYSFAPEPKVPKDSIYYEGKFKFQEINLADIFTKIKILDLFFLDGSDPGLKTLVNFINNSESLKGLICKRDMLHELSIKCQHIEMLATDGLNDYYTNQGYGAKLSQLSLFEVVFTDFALNTKYLPGLHRLHLKTYSHDQRESNGPYSGPELKHLEILELLTWVGNLHVYYGFQFMDYCPSLKSAFITIEFVAEIFINKSILNYNLQDLVITFANGIDLKVLPAILVKYPNIKHLGILLYGSARSKIKEHHIIELFNILPKLVVLDLTGSLLKKSAIDFIDQYCLKNHRQITLYDGRHRFVPKPLRCYKRITEDFDFLRNVFFKNRKSYNLPLLMDQCFDTV